MAGGVQANVGSCVASLNEIRVSYAYVSFDSQSCYDVYIFKSSQVHTFIDTMHECNTTL